MLNNDAVNLGSQIRNTTNDESGDLIWIVNQTSQHGMPI
jgi:hypothetical protein